MSETPATAPAFHIAPGEGQTTVTVSGDWSLDGTAPPIEALLEQLQPGSEQLVLVPGENFSWDSRFMSLVYLIAGGDPGRNIDLQAMPEGVHTLHELATAVPPAPPREPASGPGISQRLSDIGESVTDFLTFIGDVTRAFIKTFGGRSNTRRIDFLHFVEASGPNAIGIITLVSVLVGMILAYLGAVQLRQFGAQIFVANLVTLGMVREMGALMTAVIMAGRTGAAYAAQLGTMQTREEIDAITTLGLSPVEFLVVPRMLALVVVMPLLVMYANLLGMLGGAIVALGMDITFIQYFNQAQGSVGFMDFATGLFKSVVFAALIATAGCQAGLACGRSSAAVGEATTTAVVKALVYIIVADATLNILFQQLGI